MVEASEQYTYIFCFGSNGPKQLSERCRIPIDDLLTRTKPARLQGWKRGFCGTSRSWKNTSPATIFETGDEKNVVIGLAVAMTSDEIESLDPYEGYPYVYDRKKVTMKSTMGGKEETLEGEAYIRVKTNEEFVFPCDSYLRACAKTIYKCLQLEEQDPSPCVMFDVVNGTSKELERKVEVTLTDNELANL